MATLLMVVCRQCGKETDEMDGAIMAGPRPRCLQCGRSGLIPVEDLMAARADESSEWTDRHLGQLAGVCTCGGTFSEDAPLRCTKCRSTDLDRHVYGNAD